MSKIIFKPKRKDQKEVYIEAGTKFFCYKPNLWVRLFKSNCKKQQAYNVTILGTIHRTVRDTLDYTTTYLDKIRDKYCVFEHKYCVTENFRETKILHQTKNEYFSMID